MSDKIRRIEERDFNEVSALYNDRKSVKELKWLFTNPNDSTIYNAFVAENNKNQIVGVIGYVLSIYTQNDNNFWGIIPMSWKIMADYKGLAGILLFKKAIGLGDFSFVISGTDTALGLYPLFKFKKSIEITQFYKILNISKTLKSYKRKKIIKTYGVISYLLPSYFKNLNKKSIYQDVELIRYDHTNYVEELQFDQVLKKEVSKNYIDWLLSCPVVDSSAFIIKKGDKNFGICVLYTKTVNRAKRGRIAYLPFLGDDNRLWNTVITKCTEILKKKKCYFITAQSHHKMTTSGYSNSGFIKINKHHDPLFIKDPKNKLKSINIENWHLQYSEGDKFYIGL